MIKKRIVVVCPGRGSYTKDNLGSLTQVGVGRQKLETFDALRGQSGLPTISELDSAKTFRTSLHTKGEHASPLIALCSWVDFLSIDQSRYEIVAITGNSMGWYLALAFSGALDTKASFHLIQTMGSMMTEGLIGGQIIYPMTNEHWQLDPKKRQLVEDTIQSTNVQPDCETYISIELGGYLVIGGNAKGLSTLMKSLPPVEHYPFQLINHGAFHTPLLKEVSHRAFEQISQDLFKKPKYPLIDGRGHIWQPYASEISKLYQYTLGHQVYEKYNFTAAISKALREFSPDHLVLLGPGNSLGGAMGQIMIENQWLGITTKDVFSSHQKKDPFLLSMGLEKQRQNLVSPARPLNSNSVPNRF